MAQTVVIEFGDRLWAVQLGGLQAQPLDTRALVL